jgi:hypothetical protein
VRGASDLDKELVDELGCNLEEELPDIGHRMFSWVVVSPNPVTESHLHARTWRMSHCRILDNIG